MTERSGIDDAVEDTRAGAVVRIRVTPRSRRPGVRVAAGRLAVGVKAPAERGKATEEALREVASLLGVPRSSVALLGGGASRDKRLLVANITPSDLRKRIREGLGRQR